MHATPIADVEIGFVSNETEVSEGEQAVLVVRVLAGQFPEGVVVNVFFQTIPGSATGRYSNNHLSIAAVSLLRDLFLWDLKEIGVCVACRFCMFT